MYGFSLSCILKVSKFLFILNYYYCFLFCGFYFFVLYCCCLMWMKFLVFMFPVTDNLSCLLNFSAFTFLCHACQQRKTCEYHRETHL